MSCCCCCCRYVFLGERLTPLQLFGAAITLGAVYLINTNHRPKEE